MIALIILTSRCFEISGTCFALGIGDGHIDHYAAFTGRSIAGLPSQVEYCQHARRRPESAWHDSDEVVWVGFVEINIYRLFFKSAACDGAGAKPEKIGAAQMFALLKPSGLNASFSEVQR
jgi:hypothetical protein